MKSMRYAVLIALLALPLAFASPAMAAVNVGVGIGVGVGPGYVAGPPVCAYGYYPDYPYACAPYGYYGPSWFAGGVFIGAGPWYHGWGHPVYPARGFVGHGYVGRGYVGHGYVGHGYGGHGTVARSGGGFHGGGFRGGR
jgi:hypothetical protein